MQFSILPYDLYPKNALNTSKGVIYKKPTFFIKLDYLDQSFYAEAPFLLSHTKEDIRQIRNKLFQIKDFLEVTKSFNQKDLIKKFALNHLPSVKLALAMLTCQINNNQSLNFFNCKKNLIIKTQGIVWLSNLQQTKQQIKELLKDQFEIIKIKISPNNISKTLKLLTKLDLKRTKLRLACNGSFTYSSLMKFSKQFESLNIDCFEQAFPINRVNDYQKFSKHNFKIALDESLWTSRLSTADKIKKVRLCAADAIILRPLLLGGFDETIKLIQFAESNGLKVWIHSLLESNLTLLAYYQLVCKYLPKQIHGLSLGKTYLNNIINPIDREKDYLSLNSNNISIKNLWGSTLK